MKKWYWFVGCLWILMGGCNKVAEQVAKLYPGTVRNIVWDKFATIEDSLATSADSLLQLSDNLRTSLPDSTKAKADALKGYVNEAIAYQQLLARELVEVSGGREADGSLKDPGNYKDPTAYLLGEEGGQTGKAYELKPRTDGAIAAINALDDRLTFETIAKNAWEIEMFKDDPEKKDKDFAQLNFDRTPVVACLAILREMEHDMRQIEWEAMQVLGGESNTSR